MSESNLVREQHEFWMRRAIQLAYQGQYSTRPNPNVGCVIVKDGQHVGEGFHPKAGQPHAEVFAMRDAGEAARGATAYVTLEPCAHYGRTPPCAKGLVEAGVAQVVVACPDPNPLVAGKGVQILRDAGIEVITGVCEAEAHQLNLGFLKAMATQMNTVKWLTGLAVIGLIACTPATNTDDSYGSGFVEVDEITWSEKNTKPYPFTVASGEISCGSHPKFGRTVYFEPKGFTDESYVGTPLNKSAVNSMKLGRLTSNVPHGVKKGADLSEAIQIGLTVCNEQQDRFENS